MFVGLEKPVSLVSDFVVDAFLDLENFVLLFGRLLDNTYMVDGSMYGGGYDIFNRKYFLLFIGALLRRNREQVF